MAENFRKKKRTDLTLSERKVRFMGQSMRYAVPVNNIHRPIRAEGVQAMMERIVDILIALHICEEVPELSLTELPLQTTPFPAAAFSD